MAGLIGAAGSGESAEGTGETSRHSQSGLEPCWSNVPQLQLVSKLDSWWSSSSAVQVHLGDTGLKTHGLSQRQKGRPGTAYQG